MADEERKKRLQELRDRAQGKITAEKSEKVQNETQVQIQKAKDDTSGDSSDKVDKKAPEEEEKVVKLERNIIKEELRKIKESQDESVLNIAPRKSDWDLKRDASAKLGKLQRRTQRAIVEILKERMTSEEPETSSGGESSAGSESD